MALQSGGLARCSHRERLRFTCQRNYGKAARLVGSRHIPRRQEVLSRPRMRLGVQLRYRLVEALHFLDKVRLHLDGSLADLVAVSADGFAPRFYLIKMLNLFFDSADCLFQRQDGVLGQRRLIALPDAKSARHTVRRFDVEIGRGVVVIPNDHNVLPIPCEREHFGRARLFRKHEYSNGGVSVISGNIDLCKGRSEVVSLVFLRLPRNACTGSRALRTQLNHVVAFFAILS